MKKTEENKAKFFAQYLGCEAEYCFDGKPFRGTKKVEALTVHNLELMLFSAHRKILLRPLSSITGEEAKEFIAVALSDPQNEYDDSGDIDASEVFIDSIEETEVEVRFDVSVRCWEGLVIYGLERGVFYTVNDEDIQPIFTGSILIDWLRNKGFAVCYNNISVKEQIEYGWIKFN